MINIKKVNFNNSTGDTLVGVISNPSGELDKPIIIIAHGLSSNKDGGSSTELEDILNRHNISTFRFDFYGHGESEGEFEDITLTEAIDDILKAVEFLKSNGYEHVGLVGVSFGGAASIEAASKLDKGDLFVLALKSPVSNYLEKERQSKSQQELDDWQKKGIREYTRGDGKKLTLKYTFFEDLSNHNGLIAATKIQIPTVIVHGDKDDIVPVEQSRQLSEIITDSELHIIKGASHRYENLEHEKEASKILSEFVLENSMEILWGTRTIKASFKNDGL